MEIEAEDRAVRAILSRSLDHAKDKLHKSRKQIASEMTALLRRCTPITEHILYGFTGQSPSKHSQKFPAAWIRAFCEATGSDELQRFILTQQQRASLAVGDRAMALREEMESAAKLKNETSRELTN